MGMDRARPVDGVASTTADIGTPSPAPSQRRSVHDYENGMPVSQGELVRDMMEWFAGREDFSPPDERTVRRKVSAIWREMKSA